MELKIELDGKEITNRILNSPRPSVKERLEEQLELLSKASVDCPDDFALCELTRTMIVLADALRHT